MRIFHLVDRFEADATTEQRCSAAYASWDTLYASGELIPIHAWPESYTRNAKELGDPRPLPFLKELFGKFLTQSRPDDFCLWSNCDTILHPLISEYVRFHCSVYGPASFLRAEFHHPPSLDLSPENYGKRSTAKHIGRDAFAFPKAWLEQVWDELPGYVVAAANWDLCFAAMVRNTYGIKTNGANLGAQMLPAEPVIGYVGHIAHASAWHEPSLRMSPSNVHNGKLFSEWAGKHAPEMVFTPEWNLQLC